VNDDAVGDIVLQLERSSSLIVHTSGSLPMEVLASASPDHGVLYPLQTFSLPRTVSMRGVPLCIEASGNKQLAILAELASSISGHVYELDSQQRLCLHIAAIFTNNFTNYLYTLAGGILDKCGLPAVLLHPLMQETAAKAIQMGASGTQTGPAVRGDEETISMHLEWLKDNKDLFEVYELLSRQLSANSKMKSPDAE
jgi:predicted short-subunit dehydrogenase-like oxidoreductase (DUF2520 family)